MAAAASEGLNLLGSLVGGIFQHHAAAVKNEATALNTVIPEVLSSFKQIVDGVNAGQFSPNQAAQYIDAVMTQYDTVVYQQFQVKRKDCNGPCVVAKILSAGAEQIKSAMSAGSGVATVGQIYGNAGTHSVPATTYVIDVPTNAISQATGQLGLTASNAADSIAASADSLTESLGLGPLGTVAFGNQQIPVLYIIGAFGMFLLLMLFSSSSSSPAQPQVIVLKK